MTIPLDHIKHLQDLVNTEQDTQNINQAVSNSFWMKNMIEQKLGLKAWITPILVFTNAFVEFGKPIKGVHYLNKKFLLQFLQRTNASSPAGLKLWEMRGKNE